MDSQKNAVTEKHLSILEASFKQTGASRKVDTNGMLEMQARAYKSVDSQYLLLKSPPASGKSRALMFLALNKLHKQGLKKVIVAVPETSIGASFKSTKLTDYGFFTDWIVDPKYNLCVAGGDDGKVAAFIQFMSDDGASVLVCTHHALRAAFTRFDPSDFDNTLFGIDEFHHISSADNNKLGGFLDTIMDSSTAHVIGMTGSYFRGDAVPILPPEYEALFKQVTYSYYEQLNGYTHLKSLSINYHFYSQGYLSSLGEVIDTNLKTIIHIPSVNSSESTKKKLDELDYIIDIIGTVISKDTNSGVLNVQDKTGRMLKVADLVTDDKARANVQAYLNTVTEPEDLDIIIALGMAKEGFDWIWCEHVLTIGYRSSLTEVVQIIGRATRDAPNKSQARFSNLIYEPNATSGDVSKAINNLLKAITLSLLMQDVLSPSINFKPRSRATTADYQDKTTIILDDSYKPASDAMVRALENMKNIKATLMQNNETSISSVMTGQQPPQVFIESELTTAIAHIHPDLDEGELLDAAKALYIQLEIQRTGGISSDDNLPDDVDFHDSDNNLPANTEPPKPSVIFSDATDNRNNSDISCSKKLALIGDKFIDVNNINFSMIDSALSNVNPFKDIYSIFSKSINAHSLSALEAYVSSQRSSMTAKEAYALYKHIVAFKDENKRIPQLTQIDHYENRLALALALIKEETRKKLAEKAAREQL